MMSIAITLGLLPAVAMAVPWAGPEPTNAAAGRPPPPRIAPTPAPRALFKRDDPGICAYIDGSTNYPYSCASSATCTINTSLNVIGCCSASTCSYSTTCMHSTEYWSSCASTSSCNGNTAIAACWQSDQPYCGTYSGIEADGNTILAFACSTTSFDSSFVINVGGTATTTSTTGRSTAAAATTRTTPAISGTAALAPAPATATPSSTSLAGPIAGGVVGGLAILVAGAVAMFWIKQRNKKRTAMAAAAAPVVQQENVYYEPVKQALSPPPPQYPPQAVEVAGSPVPLLGALHERPAEGRY